MFVAPSTIHGLGLFAGEDIEWGRRIIEYQGQRISQTEVKRRQKFYDSIGFTCLVLLLGLVPFSVQAQTVDPQSLIGEWRGAWAWTNNPSVNGQYYMTITKVEGDKVYGRVERGGLPAAYRAVANFNFAGTLSGYVLTFVVCAPAGKTELTISDGGKEMLVQGYGTNRVDISLSKK